MDEVIKILKEAVDKLTALVSSNETLKNELKSKLAALDDQIAKHKKLIEEHEARLASLQKRESLCDSSDLIRERENAVQEKEKKLKGDQAVHEEKVKKHDQRIKDESATLEAAQKRLHDGEAALEKERQEYRTRLKKEFLDSVKTIGE